MDGRVTAAWPSTAKRHTNPWKNSAAPGPQGNSPRSCGICFRRRPVRSSVFESVSAGKSARVYDFAVEQPRSHWHVQVASQSINPAYKGSVWIDPESSRVLRIEMQARLLPEEFPLDTVESAVDYDKVRIGNGQYLLPVHAESLSCERGTSNCTRNTIDFRNYHAYEASSSVAFENKLTPGSAGRTLPEPRRLLGHPATSQGQHTSNDWATRRGSG